MIPQTPEYLRTSDLQREAARPELSVWVTANAGAGKTKVLIDRVARLLLQGVPPDSILCVTYTKAAANEMQERLFKRLGQWCVMEEATLQKALNDLEGLEGDMARDVEDIRAARALFAKALETPGGLRIETIHAFCSRVLRRFPLEAEIPPGFSEMDETETREMWEQVRKSVLTNEIEDPAWRDALSKSVQAVGGLGLSGLIPEIIRVSGAMDRALEEAGSIKELADTIENRLAAPTESVTELMEAALGRELPRSDIRNALQILVSASGKTDTATASALEIVLGNASVDERWAAYQNVFRTKSGSLRAGNPYTKPFDTTIVGDLFRIKDFPEGDEFRRFVNVEKAIKSRQTADLTIALMILSAPMLKARTRLKARRAGLDFDDLIERTRYLMSGRGLAEWVLYKLDGQLSHILLDEAQDTSPEQWDVINALLAEFFSGLGASDLQRTLFVVGDEKQSIYSFQGADPEKFLFEGDEFRRRNAASDLPHAAPELVMSFRSTPQVLQYVDEVFAADRFATGSAFSATASETKDALKHIPFRGTHAGLVELWPLETPEDSEPSEPWDAPLDMESAVSPKAKLASQIATSVDGVLTRGDAVWAEEGGKWVQRAARPEDVLILVRGRASGLFDAIIQALKAKGLPVAGADRLRLLDALPVQDLLNLLRFAVLPEDDLVVAELMKSPFIGLVDDDLDLLPIAHNRGSKTLWQALCASKDPKYTEARVFLSACLEGTDRPAFEFLSDALEYRFEDGTNGWKRIYARFSKPAIDPIEALLSMALSFDSVGAASIQAFLSYILLDETEIKRELSAPEGEIRVMTVHGSKGLEAPIVILPDTTRSATGGSRNLILQDQDGLPFRVGKKEDDPDLIQKLRAEQEAADLREHRRLLYVALTRARDRLLVCGAWAGKSKTGYSEDSWYSLCQSGMQKLVDDGRAEEVDGVYRLGAPPVAIDKTSARSDGAETLPVWVTEIVPVPRSERRVVSPSGLIPGEAPVIPPFGPKRVDRLKRGRLIHGLLEVLPDAEEGELVARADLYLSQAGSLTDDERDEIKRAAFALINDPQFAEVFRPGGRAEAPIVGSGEGLPEGTLINGRVDRLVVTDDKVLIVDFKSDRPAPPSPEAVGRPYLAQMGAYKAVLAATYPDREVVCALVWTDGPKMMLLSDQLMKDALRTARSGV